MPRPLALLPVAGAPLPRPLFKGLGVSATGLAAQRLRMEVIAQNLANADVTRGADGGPYRRRDVALREATANDDPTRGGAPVGVVGTMRAPRAPFGSKPFEVPALTDAPRGIPIPLPPHDDGLHGVAVDGITEAAEDAGKLVYEPGHPDANEQGYVRYPDVDPVQEQVALLEAKRLYEANATVFQATKQMLRAALDI